MSFGSYPDVSLALARERREHSRTLLAQNIDPQTHRQETEQAKQNELNSTFESVAWAWYEHRKTRANFSESYAKDVKRLLERLLLPAFGHLPISHITAPLALKAFKPLQDKGTLEIVAVAFRLGAVYIKFIGTHSEYDRINADTVEL